MLDVLELVRYILVDVDATALERALYQSRQQFAQLYGGVESIAVAAGTTTVALAPDTEDVMYALFDRTILDRASEAIADATDPDWRSADNDTPRNYFYKGEQQLQYLRLHPTPDEDGELQVVKQLPADPDIAFWHNAYFVLDVALQLVISDLLHARPAAVEILNDLRALLLAPFSAAEKREARL